MEKLTEYMLGRLIRLMDEVAHMRTSLPENTKEHIFHLHHVLTEFCAQFDINSPTQLNPSAYQKAIIWLKLQNGNTKQTRPILPDKMPLSKAIIIRAKKDYHLNEFKIMNLAFYMLSLEKRVWRLHSLNIEQLKTLERMLFHKYKNELKNGNFNPQYFLDLS